MITPDECDLVTEYPVELVPVTVAEQAAFYDRWVESLRVRTF